MTIETRQFLDLVWNRPGHLSEALFRDPGNAPGMAVAADWGTLSRL
jgi:hypothetical protein